MKLFRTLVLLIAGALTAPAFAHQQKAAISTILFNPHTHNIEISHRFYLHDAEHAVRVIFGTRADILGSFKTRQEFNDYVAERFTLKDENGEVIPLASVGFEVEGKFFWVYQETSQPQKLTNMTVEYDALRDIWPSQINTINIEANGDIQTLTFQDKVKLLEVSF